VCSESSTTGSRTAECLGVGRYFSTESRPDALRYGTLADQISVSTSRVPSSVVDLRKGNIAMRYGLTMPVSGERVAENLLLAGSGLVLHIDVQRIQHVGERDARG
jgi:hypothetical protein